MRVARFVIGLCSFVFAACESAKTPAVGSANLAEAVLGAGATSPYGAPLTQEALRTESPDIAMGNLDSAIAARERTLKARPAEPLVVAGLAGLLQVRGQYAGRIADYERGAALAERLVALAPADAASYLARAHARSIFHRFPEALADLDRAVKLGATGSESLRASILFAQGRLDDALALAERAFRTSPSIGTATTLASIRAERGDVAGADALFVKAQKLLGDVSPMLLSYLYLQHGHLWEQQDRADRALPLYEAAYQRLPGYPAAATHYAAALAARPSARRQALAVLRPIVERSDDPEHGGTLSALLRSVGEREEAARLVLGAKARYEALLAKHEAAFLDHAARFFLLAGDDPPRALVLARRNFALFPHRRAAALVVEAALRARDTKEACTRGVALLQTPGLAPQLRALGERGREACASAAAR